MKLKNKLNSKTQTIDLKQTPPQSPSFKNKFKLSRIEIACLALVPIGGAAWLYFQKPMPPQAREVASVAPVIVAPAPDYSDLAALLPESPKLAVEKPILRIAAAPIKEKATSPKIAIQTPIPSPPKEEENELELNQAFAALDQFNREANAVLKKNQEEEIKRAALNPPDVRPTQRGRFFSSSAPAPASSNSCGIVRPASPDPSCRAQYPCRYCGGCCCNSEAHAAGLLANIAR